jgi:hypothetical protein
MNNRTQDVEIFMGGNGKHVRLKVGSEEMERLRTICDRPAINFVSVKDADGEMHVFNTGEILAITKPGCHCLYEDQTQDRQFALQLYDKELISLSELRQVFGLNSKLGTGKKQRKAGL